MYESTPKIRKEEEFFAFIKILSNETVGHWINVAQVIGVDKDTITEWKKRPEARGAIKKSINKAMSCMEKVGKNDWRMWQAKLKMLGIVGIDKTELNVTSKPRKVVVGFNYIVPKEYKDNYGKTNVPK